MVCVYLPNLLAICLTLLFVRELANDPRYAVALRALSHAQITPEDAILRYPHQKIVKPQLSHVGIQPWPSMSNPLILIISFPQGECYDCSR
jgi:hypothetical protein